MAQAPTATEHRERDVEKHEKSTLVVVELKKRRTPEQVRRLRKGRGPLVTDIEDVIGDLAENGTIKANAQPVVIVVREVTAVPLPWPFNAANLPDEDDDDEDDDD